ncbi:MAG: AAA family ATPase [bacterium]
MFLDKLLVEGFRGIRDKLELDLTARLTLIYAPNGMGKTSLCDSVEWLLTGGVERLNKSTGQEGIKCIFTPRPAAVEAVLDVERQGFKLRREYLNNNQTSLKLWDFGSSRFRNFTLAHLLDLISPGELPPGTNHKHANTVRSTWLRAIRFLAGSSLDLLIDTSKQAIETRGLMFSDLFGVGELQRQEDDLSQIRKRLPASRTLSSELENVTTKLKAMHEKIAAASANASEPLHAAVRANIQTAAKLLKVDIGEYNNEPSSTILHDLQARRAKAQVALDRRRSALQNVSRQWTQYQALTDEDARFHKQLADLSDTYQKLNTEIGPKHDELRKKSEYHKELTFEVSKLEGWQKKIISRGTSLQQALVSWKNAGGSQESPLELQMLESAAAESQAALDTAEQYQNFLSTCERELPGWQQAFKQLSTGRHKYATT